MFLIVAIPMSAQLTGTVINKKGKPAKGVKVFQKSTLEFVETSKDGVFHFDGIKPSDTLVIHLNRSTDAIFGVDTSKTITVMLGKESFVVKGDGQERTIGYAKVYRSYSSNIITKEQIAKLSANSIYDIFRSSVTGVRVSEDSDGTKIIIRGGNSFESSLEPLFIVDGTQYESSEEVDRLINVNDIETIEIDKDGGGYGVKGANGVIIITTSK